MPYSNNIMTAIDAALDNDTDDEFLIDDINSHRRPPPWSMAEDRL
jgi:hypothetical protein